MEYTHLRVSLRPHSTPAPSSLFMIILGMGTPHLLLRAWKERLTPQRVPSICHPWHWYSHEHTAHGGRAPAGSEPRSETGHPGHPVQLWSNMIRRPDKMGSLQSDVQKGSQSVLFFVCLEVFFYSVACLICWVISLTSVIGKRSLYQIILHPKRQSSSECPGNLPSVWLIEIKKANIYYFLCPSSGGW